MTASTPEIFSDQIDHGAYAADDEEMQATATRAEDGAVAAYPPTPALEHSGVQRAGQDDQVPDSEGIQPTGQGQSRLAQRPNAKDHFHAQEKRTGVLCSEIRAKGNLTEARLILRGCFSPTRLRRHYIQPSNQISQVRTSFSSILEGAALVEAQ